MMKPKVALFTVFYPGVEKFTDDFIASINAQSYSDFDLVIVNDNYTGESVAKLSPQLSVIELQYNSSIAGNRQFGINYIKGKGYDILVLCDADDYFHPTRVEKTIEALRDFDIAVHDLDIVGSEGTLLCQGYFEKNESDKSSIGRDFIRTKNVLGFSNSAFRLSAINDEVIFPTDVKIVDWYFYTSLIYGGSTVKYIPEALTYYRQHSNNLIGVDDFSIDLFKRMLSFKLCHCKLCAQYDDYFEKEAATLKRIGAMPDAQIKEIIMNNKNRTPYPLWWENITL